MTSESVTCIKGNNFVFGYFGRFKRKFVSILMKTQILCARKISRDCLITFQCFSTFAQSENREIGKCFPKRNVFERNERITRKSIQLLFQHMLTVDLCLITRLFHASPMRKSLHNPEQTTIAKPPRKKLHFREESKLTLCMKEYTPCKNLLFHPARLPHFFPGILRRKNGASRLIY